MDMPYPIPSLLENPSSRNRARVATKRLRIVIRHLLQTPEVRMSLLNDRLQQENFLLRFW